jgi:hypothetical protein
MASETINKFHVESITTLIVTPLQLVLTSTYEVAWG